jgi:hypothetical protein
MKALCAATLGLWTMIAAAADEPPPGPGVLLLRNGQMIEGRVSREDDHYLVRFPDGEIRLRSVDVELYCRNLEEGYQRKRAAIAAGNVQDHLDLAQWCQRHKLYRYAADELAAAAAIDPSHPMLGVLRRRQDMAQEPPWQPSAPTAKAAGPSAEDLDRMTRGLPPGAVETFAQVVQPLLMNHCMASGCHGPQSETAFRLMRIPVNQPPGRRLTQRNLHAVLQFVNYNDAQASRLLAAISGPHATLKAAIFADRQAGHYKQLADWVNQVSGHAGPAEIPASVLFGRDQAAPAGRATTPASNTPAARLAAQPRLLSPAAACGRPMPLPGKDGKAGPVRAAAAVEADDEPEAPAGRSSKSRPRPAGAHAAPKPAAGAEDAAAVDPFDPEVFNRRYADKAEGGGGSARN